MLTSLMIRWKKEQMGRKEQFRRTQIIRHQLEQDIVSRTRT